MARSGRDDQNDRLYFWEETEEGNESVDENDDDVSDDDERSHRGPIGRPMTSKGKKTLKICRHFSYAIISNAVELGWEEQEVANLIKLVANQLNFDESQLIRCLEKTCTGSPATISCLLDGSSYSFSVPQLVSVILSNARHTDHFISLMGEACECDLFDLSKLETIQKLHLFVENNMDQRQSQRYARLLCEHSDSKRLCGQILHQFTANMTSGEAASFMYDIVTLDFFQDIRGTMKEFLREIPRTQEDLEGMLDASHQRDRNGEILDSDADSEGNLRDFVVESDSGRSNGSGSESDGIDSDREHDTKKGKSTQNTAHTRKSVASDSEHSASPSGSPSGSDDDEEDEEGEEVSAASTSSDEERGCSRGKGRLNIASSISSCNIKEGKGGIVKLQPSAGKKRPHQSDSNSDSGSSRSGSGSSSGDRSKEKESVVKVCVKAEVKKTSTKPLKQKQKVSHNNSSNTSVSGRDAGTSTNMNVNTNVNVAVKKEKKETKRLALAVLESKSSSSSDDCEFEDSDNGSKHKKPDQSSRKDASRVGVGRGGAKSPSSSTTSKSTTSNSHNRGSSSTSSRSGGKISTASAAASAVEEDNIFEVDGEESTVAFKKGAISDY